MAQGETEDFKVNYAFAYDYFDTTPTKNSSVINFRVAQRFQEEDLGADDFFGRVFTYDLTLTNLYTDKG